jgi:hypothetical protein
MGHIVFSKPSGRSCQFEYVFSRQARGGTGARISELRHSGHSAVRRTIRTLTTQHHQNILDIVPAIRSISVTSMILEGDPE